jgi:hypothetical protein
MSRMDLNRLAAKIVRESTEPTVRDDGKDPEAVARGRRGGQKGGRVRAERMTPEQRSEAARRAAQARWASRPDADS